MQIDTIDIKLSGDVQASETAWLEPGEDVVAAIKGITADGKKIIGFTFDGEKFGVLIG